ncbi:hypothetical protein CSB45_01650 [candidate division KSB3 bacterium]|uniref:histidine kinase n=1 Tax=candidate division KSB3 bacterium TaxID=2044937 RepID=A0A2G6EAP4_9BACT|nr:MAG: hypothetical protein CSB45_01650 [candidate division KSB3 bacterium]PIE30704.1 MAG: hypothetical protein CSA57_01700 [candidate division KSB3 bacterium]
MPSLPIYSDYPEDSLQRDSLLNKIKWLMIFRIVVVTILLGSGLTIQWNVLQSRPLELLYIFIILSYAFTGLTASFLNQFGNLHLYAYFQFGYDLLFETAMVYITGGVESVFTSTYIFTIIAAGILLFRQGAFIVASLSTMLYGALVGVQFYRIQPLFIPTQPLLFTPVNSSAVYYKVFLNACAFYLVAFLSSYLSESLRKTHQRLWETSYDLTELQAFHHNILQSMHSGVMTTDLHLKLTSYNFAAEQITGYTLSEVYGKPLQDIFPELDVPQKMNPLLRNMKADRLVQRQETAIVTKSGTTVFLGVSVSLFLDNSGNVAGLICIFQDLTELKAMQEHVAQADRLAAIGQLAAGLAHEIRNPLASISGSIQMLNSELTLDIEQASLMDIVLRESKRLDHLLSDFLLYARPQSMSFAESDIMRDVILSTVGLLRQDKRFVEEKCTIHVELPQDFPKIVCDTQQLQQVFWNLCLNALQAMSKGGELRICARSERLDGWKLDARTPLEVAVISVSDTGDGLDEETLHHIFQPFYTTKKQGSGLGLAIAHTIVKNHHGVIRVKSSPQEGTTFEVVLPFVQYYW